LLSAGYAGLRPTDAAAIPLAERDRLLLAVRQITFGDTLTAFALCQTCGERLEFQLPHAWASAALEAGGASTVTVEGWLLTVRLADTADIDSAVAAPDIGSARTCLLERCVTAVDPHGATTPYHDLPDPLRVAAETALVALHEAVELSVCLACPACAEQQAIQVDVSSYLWAEARHAARRLLAEVHELAHAHGWPEATILAMSAARRRAYLEMIRA
jgi:hypothetical protein